MSEQEQTPRETLENWLVSLRSGLYVAPSEVREAIRAVLVLEHQAREIAGGAQQRVMDLEAELELGKLSHDGCHKLHLLANAKQREAEAERDALRAELTKRETAHLATIQQSEERQAEVQRVNDKAIEEVRDEIFLRKKAEAALRAARAEVERLTVLHGLAQGAEIRSVARAEKAEAALRSLTPGGSEFQTVDECVGYVRQQREQMLETVKRFKRRADAALRDTAPVTCPRHLMAGWVAALDEVFRLLDGGRP